MKYTVTVFGKVFQVDEESYHKAKSEAARLFLLKAKGIEKTYPISYITMFASCTKVEKDTLGRPRTRVDSLAGRKDGSGTD